MNIITFDIEEWAVAKNLGYGNAKLYGEYDGYLNQILDALDASNYKGTFFCTGQMAEDFPHIVKLIFSRGHEVGSHSYIHSWMNKMTETEAKEDTKHSVCALEQCIGAKVFSYRAPAFSVGASNKWMFEVLAENGITNDASVFPANRDLGGFPSFISKAPCFVEYQGIKIKEYPICPTKVLGKELAYSGGGYFRFFPLSFIKNRMSDSSYTMFYFHIGDLVPETMGLLSKEDYELYFKEKGTLKNRYLRYIKANIGKKGAFNKLLNLLQQEPFINLKQADDMISWKDVDVINV